MVTFHSNVEAAVNFLPPACVSLSLLLVLSFTPTSHCLQITQISSSFRRSNFKSLDISSIWMCERLVAVLMMLPEGAILKPWCTDFLKIIFIIKLWSGSLMAITTERIFKHSLWSVVKAVKATTIWRLNLRNAALVSRGRYPLWCWTPCRIWHSDAGYINKVVRRCTRLVLRALCLHVVTSHRGGTNKTICYPSSCNIRQLPIRHN